MYILLVAIYKTIWIYITHTQDTLSIRSIKMHVQRISESELLRLLLRLSRARATAGDAEGKWEPKKPLTWGAMPYLFCKLRSQGSKLDCVGEGSATSSVPFQSDLSLFPTGTCYLCFIPWSSSGPSPSSDKTNYVYSQFYCFPPNQLLLTL